MQLIPEPLILMIYSVLLVEYRVNGGQDYRIGRFMDVSPPGRFAPDCGRFAPVSGLFVFAPACKFAMYM